MSKEIPGEPLLIVSVPVDCCAPTESYCRPPTHLILLFSWPNHWLNCSIIDTHAPGPSFYLPITKGTTTIKGRRVVLLCYSAESLWPYLSLLAALVISFVSFYSDIVGGRNERTNSVFTGVFGALQCFIHSFYLVVIVLLR